MTTTPRSAPSRPDGRRNDELRPFTIQTDFLDARHHALVRAGGTIVLCVASIDENVPRWMKDTGLGWVTGEYSMLPGSTDTRSRREASRGRIGGRTYEIQRLIGRSLRAVCHRERLGERTIYIDCDVLQADGGTRTASITGGYVALCRAVEHLMATGAIEENPITDTLAAVSVGILEGEARLDLPYEEDSAADVDMNVVMMGHDKLVEVQGTAEGVTFSPGELQTLVGLAAKGIRELYRTQRTALADCPNLAGLWG